MRTLILAAALCLVPSAPSFAAPPKPPASQPATRPADADPLPRTEYDKFKDVTTVTLGPFPLELDKGNAPRFLTLVTTHKGEAASGIHAEILISLHGRRGAAAGEGPMIFLLDGKHRVEAPAYGKIERGAGDALVFTLDDKGLSWIADAGRVEGQGAGVEFTLKPEQVAGIREFQKAFQRPAAPTSPAKTPPRKR